MVASQLIENKIACIEPTKVFTIEDLDFPREWRENVRIKLGRMVKLGVLEKAGRGKYYKPKTSVFGNIGPSSNEIVKDLIHDNGVLSGYVTGYTIWNQMGLTSQISNVIMIGTSRRRDPLKRGNYEIRFIMQPNKITSDSIPLLQILDSLKLLKMIPDTSVGQSVRIIKKYISDLEEKRLSTLVKLVRKYPPRVRALLGAILESTGNDKYIGQLKQSLNPTSTYAIGLNEDSDINLNSWNIV
jgi:hypothetical protein